MLTKEGERFLADWQNNYPDTLPVSHALKWQFPKRWVRFHSLPNAKRYASSQDEHAIILKRQNAIINALIPQGIAIDIVLSKLDPECHLFQSYNLTPLGAITDPSAEGPTEAWLMNDVWEAGGLDVVLMMVAGDQARMIIMAPDCLIAPYDGGIDVIAKDPFTAHALKRQFSHWVSAREDGL